MEQTTEAPSQDRLSGWDIRPFMEYADGNVEWRMNQLLHQSQSHSQPHHPSPAGREALVGSQHQPVITPPHHDPRLHHPHFGMLTVRREDASMESDSEADSSSVEEIDSCESESSDDVDESSERARIQMERMRRQHRIQGRHAPAATASMTALTPMKRHHSSTMASAHLSPYSFTSIPLSGLPHTPHIDLLDVAQVKVSHMLACQEVFNYMMSGSAQSHWALYSALPASARMS